MNTSLLSHVLVVIAIVLVAGANALFAVPGEEGEAVAESKPAPEGVRAIDGFRFPEDLQVKLFAGDDMLANPIAIEVDEKGRVFIAETFRQSFGVEDNRDHMYWLIDDLAAQTVEDRVEKYRKHDGRKRKFSDLSAREDRIAWVQDTDGDGVADKRGIFQDGFNEVPDGSGAGILAIDGKVYYTCIPHLWLMKDTNGDGKADSKESLSYGYGIRDALRGHDLHGLVMGPDGKLYFSLGDRGYNITTKEGKHLVDPMDAGRGAVFRCNLDGSDLEIFAWGLRNPQELAFDAYGNLFTGDNNSDSGDRARLVYVVEGGDTGWSMAFQTMEGDYSRGPFNAEKHWHTQHIGQPAWVIPPVTHITAGPSGMTYYPGVGLPDRYDNHFFLVDFRGGPSGSGIWAFDVKPKGAGFEIGTPEQFLFNVLATDVTFGYDGKMYVSDFINGWTGVNSARIYTVHDPAQKDGDAVAEVTKIIADGFAGQPADALAKLLSHDDMRIRLRAQYELAAQKKSDVLAAAASNGKSQFERFHGIWGLGQMGDTEPVVALLADDDAEIRAQAARVLGDGQQGKATAALITQLNDSNARSRYHAALALGKIGDAAAIEPVLHLLRRNADTDVFLRHAGVMALAGIGDADALLTHADDPSAGVRMGILLALRKMQEPRIARFLKDAEPLIVVEASRAIYDLQIADARDALANLIHQPLPTMAMYDQKQTEFALHRRILNTHRILGRPSNISALAKYAADDSRPELMRREAVEILADLSSPNVRDRVLGYYRPVEPRDAETIANAIEPYVPAMLASAEGELNGMVTSLAARYNIQLDANALLVTLIDESKPVSSRIASLRAIYSTAPAKIALAFQIALASEQAPVRAAGLELLAQDDPDAALKKIQQFLTQEDIADQQAALAVLPTIADSRSHEMLLEQLRGFADVHEAVRLDLLLAAEASGDDRVRHIAAGALPPGNDTFSYISAGGDAAAGRQLFYSHAAAQCLRCHSINGAGGNAGPDLAGLASRVDREYIVESMINPSAKVAEGWGTISVIRKDNSSVGGLLRSDENGIITIEQADGSVVKVNAADVATRTPPLSAMPPMKGILTAKQMRDVVEYLGTLK